MKIKENYTQAEINSNINKLKNKEEDLLNQRKFINQFINQEIKQVRCNVRYYEELDLSQTGIF